MISVNNWPARPTNGSPRSSSSAPGPSPTNINSAFGLPTPNTRFLRPGASLHRVQSPINSRNASKVSVFSNPGYNENNSRPASTGTLDGGFAGLAGDAAAIASATAAAIGGGSKGTPS